MTKTRIVGLVLVGHALALGVAFLAVWHWDDFEVAYSVVPGYPDLLAWEYDSKPGVSTRGEMLAAFGRPTDELDEGRTCVWRSMYRDTFTVYRHWLYRTKPVGSVETFFTESVTATFDENGVLRTLTWQHAEPVSHAHTLPQGI